jgi:hypothetical protein
MSPLVFITPVLPSSFYEFCYRRRDSFVYAELQKEV